MNSSCKCAGGGRARKHFSKLTLICTQNLFAISISPTLPDERMKIGSVNHVSFNFRRWNREKSSRKTSCHKLELYGLLDSNKIYIFLSFCRLGDGDRSEKDRHSPWNIKKHFRFHIDTNKISVEIPSGRALKNSCMFSHHISLGKKGWQNCILIMEGMAKKYYLIIRFHFINFLSTMETSRRQTEAEQGNVDVDERNESNKSGEKRKFPLQLQQRLLQEKKRKTDDLEWKAKSREKVVNYNWNFIKFLSLLIKRDRLPLSRTSKLGASSSVHTLPIAINYSFLIITLGRGVTFQIILNQSVMQRFPGFHSHHLPNSLDTAPASDSFVASMVFFAIKFSNRQRMSDFQGMHWWCWLFFEPFLFSSVTLSRFP